MPHFACVRVKQRDFPVALFADEDFCLFAHEVERSAKAAADARYVEYFSILDGHPSGALFADVVGLWLFREVGIMAAVGAGGEMRPYFFAAHYSRTRIDKHEGADTEKWIGGGPYV